MKNRRYYDEIIRGAYENLTNSEKMVADFILSNSYSVLIMTLSQLSIDIGVSENIIVSFVEKVGFNGYTQFKMKLLEDFYK